MATFAFALCAAPTIVSYQPYLYQWDDSSYLVDSIVASRAFWSGDRHGLRVLMQGNHPPIMALLGLPWGPLAGWDAAGKCFLSLAVLTALFVAICLYLMLRSGVNTSFFVVASVCLLAAMGPFPAGADVVQIGGPRSGVHYANVHYVATSFMVDSLFAWIAFAALLLIRYEITSDRVSTLDSFVHGILWAVIFSVGAITKVNFFYFIALIVPTLFVIRTRNHGIRNGLVMLLSFAICSLPAIVYWLRYGRTAPRFALNASFRHDASLYYTPLFSYVSRTVRLSPGLLLAGTVLIGEAVYFAIKRVDIKWGACALPILVLMGYGTVALASSNREIRFLFPVFIALPFLIGIGFPGKTYFYTPKAAMQAAVFVFCCLV